MGPSRTVTRDVAGALASGDDGAILFNGSSGVVRMGDVFDITAGSYELWIKRSNTTAALQYIMDKGPGQPNIALLSDHSIYVGEENVVAVLVRPDQRHQLAPHRLHSSGWRGLGSSQALHRRG